MQIKYVIISLISKKYFDWYGCEGGCIELDIEQIRNGIYESLEDAQNSIVEYEDFLDGEIIEIKKIIIIK